MLETIAVVAGGILSVVSVLAFISGTVWWCSSVYHELRGMRAELKNISTTYAETSKALWDQVESHRARIENHEVRITRMEGER